MEYNFRQLSLSGFKERKFCLKDDVIVIQSPDRQEIILPFINIKSIQLTHNPTKKDWNRFGCTIRTLDGFKIKLSNKSILNRFEIKDQSSQYKSFLESLHQRLVSKDIAIKYYGGLLPKQYYFQLFFSILCFTAIAIWFSMSSNNVFSHPVAIAIYCIAWSIFLFGTFRRNYPREYDQKDLPSELLPK